MNKVLIITYNYPPDNAPAAQRPAAFHKYLETPSVVLTPTNSVSALGASGDVIIDDTVIRYGDVSVLSTSVANSVSKASKKSLKRRLFSELKIPDKAIVWYRSALKKGKEILKNDSSFTHIYSTSPSTTNHLVAMKLARKFKLKWIADFRDYYYIETIENANYIFRSRIDKYLEKRFLKTANHVTFISESMKKEYIKRYPFIASKTSAIYNGFDPSEFGSGVSLNNEKLTIFYAGTFYDGVRSPYPLFEALDNLSNKNLIDLKKVSIEVAGRLDERIIERINSYNSSSCFNYLGLISREEVLERYSKSSVLWLIVGDKISHHTGFPIKGYEYLGSRRPILAFTPVPSEAAKILQEVEGCYIFNLKEPENFSNKLERLYSDFLEGRLNQPMNFKNIEKYTRPHQATLLDKLMDEI